MSSPKVALVTGIAGQDGSYLAHLLIKKGYVVHGTIRRSSEEKTLRLDALRSLSYVSPDNLHLHHSDLTDGISLFRLLKRIHPHEVYNLAAQSHVHTSFETPEYTANADGSGTLRLLGAIHALDMTKEIRFYQASTSELFGKVAEIPQKETTPFYPRSPYAVAKLYSYWITVNYREAYGIYACNGILFNHESPLRSSAFVTRKITLAVARIKNGLQDCLYLGNLDSKRDWGHARDYVEGMWLMLQQHEPDDYILATNKTTRIRDFLVMAFSLVDIDIIFRGVGINEEGICRKTGKVYVRIDPAFYRPTEVDVLQGSYDKAAAKLNWRPNTSVQDLCAEMINVDMRKAKNEFLALKSHYDDITVIRSAFDNNNIYDNDYTLLNDYKIQKKSRSIKENSRTLINGA